MDFAQYQRDLDRLRGAAPWNLVVVNRVSSTNTLARRIVKEYHREYTDPPRSMIVALEQSAGRGRQGRRWQSPAGEGIYTTLVLPMEDPSNLSRLPLLAAVGLAHALNGHLSEPCRLKWPNDLIVAGRKIGGLLIEAVTCEGDVVAMIGFGINHRGEVSLEGGRRATSVAQAEGETPTMPALCWRLVGEIDRALEHLQDGSWGVERYREMVLHRPGDRLKCRVAGREYLGIFRGIDEQGFLRLEADGREQRLSAGEVVEEVHEDDDG